MGLIVFNTKFIYMVIDESWPIYVIFHEITRDIMGKGINVIVLVLGNNVYVSRLMMLKLKVFTEIMRVIQLFRLSCKQRRYRIGE